MDQHRLHIVPKHYLCDPRKLNIVVSQLRCSVSSLNNDLYRVNIISNPSCQCGVDFENINHYFSEGPHYLNIRTTLFYNLN